MRIFRIIPISLLGIFILLITHAVTHAQSDIKNELGFRVYSSIHSQHLPEGDRYHPLIIAPNYLHYLSKRKTGSRFGIYIEPQIAFVSLNYDEGVKPGPLNSHEYGFNAGLYYSYWWRGTIFYAGGGSGPNFITVHTDRQAHGFIFTDNLYVGIKEKLFRRFYLDVICRGRHISNAGLKSPNSGINNYFAGGGFSVMF